MEFDRRDFIEGIGIVAVAALTADQAQASVAGPIPAKPYDIKPLPFDPSKLKGISEKMITSHHDNNYAGAVRRLNAIDAQLASLDWASAPNFLVNGLKREELIAMNSMIL